MDVRTYCALLSLTNGAYKRSGIVKDECGGVINHLFFAQTCIPIVQKRSCAYVCAYIRGGGLVSQSTLLFQNSANIQFSIFPSFIQQTTIATSFSTLPLSSNSKRTT